MPTLMLYIVSGTYMTSDIRSNKPQGYANLWGLQKTGRVKQKKVVVAVVQLGNNAMPLNSSEICHLLLKRKFLTEYINGTML